MGYGESSYTLSEDHGYAEVCVEAMSLGTPEQFYIYASTTENTVFIQYVFNVNNCVFLTDFSALISFTSSVLGFSVTNTSQYDIQCYNISADFSISNLCDYCDAVIELQLTRANQSDRVTILNGSSTAEIVVELPESCVCQTTLSSTALALSDGAIAAIVLSVIILEVVTVSFAVAVFVYCRKSKKKVNEV